MKRLRLLLSAMASDRLSRAVLISCALPAILAFAAVNARARQQPPDTLGGMPRLEIPEITIVGKKAITLPFARKGEIYDVTVYEAPPPDTSLLGDRPPITPPVGGLPRYEEPLIPWHLSAEGDLGSFATAHGRAFLDYNGKRWGYLASGGFAHTNGHTENADGTSIFAGGNAHALLAAEAANAVNVAGGLHLAHDSYGLFGYRDTATDRKRTNVLLDLRAATINRVSNAFDLGLGADIWSTTDSRAGRSLDASAVTSSIDASYRTGLADFQFESRASYASTSLDYSSDGPSLVHFSAGGTWRMTSGMHLTAGGTYDGGDGSDGSSRSIIAPYGELMWELDSDRRLSFWLRPEMTLTSPGKYAEEIPYLDARADLRPERKPVNFGGVFWYNGGPLSLEIHASFAKTSNTPVVLADSGRVALAYIDASKLEVRGDAVIRLESGALLTLTSLIRPAYEDGTTTQLPMVPLARLQGRLELSLNSPVTIWGSAEYVSKQNTDLAGTSTIKDHVVVSGGASAAFIPHIVLAGEVTNLLDTKYEWWRSYDAPGIGVRVSAKVNFR